MERDREEVFDRNRGYVQEAEADADGEEMGDGDSMAGEAAEVRAVIRKGDDEARGSISWVAYRQVR
jgi:hypothetical protein